MGNLLLSFQVVLPLCLFMGLGVWIRRRGLCGGEAVRQMNALCFRVFLPALLFHNLTECQLSSTLRPGLAAYAVGAVLLSFLLCFLLIPLAEKRNDRRGVLIQGIARSNFVLFGLPVTQALYGEESGGLAALLVAFVVPIFNAASVAALELYRGGGRPDWKKIARGIVTNPLILASLLGLASLFSGLRLPPLLQDFVGDVGGVATPFGLVVLGASCSLPGLKGAVRPLVLGVAGRLVLVPLLFLPAAAALGFRGPELAVLTALFCSPTAVSSFTMAQQMGGDSDLAAGLVAVGSACSVLTVFLWIFCFKQLGLL